MVRDSASSRDAIIDIMMRQKFSERIPGLLPFGVRVRAQDWVRQGRAQRRWHCLRWSVHLGLALMTKRAESGVEATQLLADISKLIYDEFSG